MTDTMDTFDNLLNRTLRTRAAAAPPAGLAQRVLANIANSNPHTPTRCRPALLSSPPKPASTPAAAPPRSGPPSAPTPSSSSPSSRPRSTPSSKHLKNAMTLSALEVPPPPPLAPKPDKIGGGGGQKGPTPVSEGHLPKLASEQILAPKAPPLIAPKLPVEPSVVVQPDLKMADNKMPDLGMPNSNLKGASMGNGNGTGIGSGDGSGIGPGSGTNFGGGLMHIGGSVKPPSVLFQVEPDFSEEARKAKFSGDVQVYLWVDEQGNPSHVRVYRGVGMGLDEKAIAAVKQYKFKPAMLNGKPVKVDLYIDVDFHIF